MDENREDRMPLANGLPLVMEHTPRNEEEHMRSPSIGSRVATKDGVGIVWSRSNRTRRGVKTTILLVRMPNGALYPYPAEQVERVR